MDKEIIFYDLRMLAKAENGAYTLSISVESGGVSQTLCNCL
ncbi:hypothetical protein [Psychrobacter faecalis]|nr:hypothetical protein [Psychrobacter faecalis]